MPIPPKSIQNRAEKALEIRRELPPSKRAGTPVGIARAAQLANGENLSIDTLKRMRSFIARHGPNYDIAIRRGKTNQDGGVVLAMNLWGGKAAMSWVEAELRKAGELD
jgi:hypothetical protein